MDPGEAIIRSTIWLALAGYTIGEVCRSRLWNRLGLIAYLAHVAAIFHFAHHWSHDAAYQYTAQRTEEVAGLRFGGGLWINYLFTAFWVGLAVRPRVGPTWFEWLTRGVFLFLIVNSTIVFGVGPVRWFGAGLSLVLVATWACRICGTPGRVGGLN